MIFLFIIYIFLHEIGYYYSLILFILLVQVLISYKIYSSKSLANNYIVW